MQGGSQGSIRSWVWWQENSLLILNISGNRFCANIGRQHKSNGIYMVVDLQVACPRFLSLIYRFAMHGYTSLSVCCMGLVLPARKPPVPSQNLDLA